MLKILVQAYLKETKKLVHEKLTYQAIAIKMAHLTPKMPFL